MENQVSNKIIMSGFGEPEPVLEGRRLFEYDYCPQVGDYYEYPYDIAAVASLYHSPPHRRLRKTQTRNKETAMHSPPHRRLRKPYTE